MDLVRTKKTTQLLTVVFAAVLLAGIATYLMGHQVPGIILIILAVSALVPCFGILHFYSVYAFNYLVNKGKVRKD